MKSKNIGSTLDSLFDELGESEEVELLTQKKLLSEKIERAMTQAELAKAISASSLGSSRYRGHAGNVG